MKRTIVFAINFIVYLTLFGFFTQPVISAYYQLDDITRVLEVSPNSTSVAIGRQNGQIAIMDTSGQLIYELRPEGPPVIALKWSPDGSRIVTGDAQGSTDIWNASAGQVERSLDGGFSPISGLDWSPDGTRIAVSALGAAVRIWDSTTGNVVDEFVAGETYNIAWSPDGNYLAVVGFYISIWNVSTAEEVLRLDTSTFETLVDWSFDSSKIVVANMSVDGQTHAANVLDMTTSMVITTFDDHTEQIYTAKWSPDNAFVATSSRDGSIRVWDAATGNVKQIIQEADDIVAFDWSPDGSEIVYDDIDVGITFVDSLSSTAGAGPDQTLTDSDDTGSELVTFDGSASSDPDSTIESYVWTEDDVEIGHRGQPAGEPQHRCAYYYADGH